MIVKVTGYNSPTGNPPEPLSNPIVVVGKTRHSNNNNALTSRLQVGTEETLEATGVMNNPAGLRNNALTNRLQVVTEEILEVAGVMNNPAGLRNLRVTFQRHVTLTAVVEVVAFRDLPVEIAAVAIPVVDSADQEDSDTIFFIINKAVSIDAAFFMPVRDGG
jgi:hypothetical protein